LFRLALVIFSLCSLVAVYIFQQINYASFFGISIIQYPTFSFAINKTIRLIINDVCCILLIFGLFKEKKFGRLAVIVFCFELFILLPLYLLLKLNLEGPSEISAAWLSQFHRLLVNPLLMLLLIFSFYYQLNYSKPRG
jgi:exosortase F-associated protein